MSRVAAIAVHELRGSLRQPLAYAIFAVFMVAVGIDLVGRLSAPLDGAADLSTMASVNPRSVARALFENMAALLIIVVPAVSMRLVAGEVERRSIDTLLAAPLTSVQIAVGKYLGGLAVTLIMLATALPAVAILATDGAGSIIPLASGFLGTALLASVYLSLGLLASCVASTQTVAYLAGFGANLCIWSVDRLGSAGGPWGDALGEALSVQRRMASFNSGIVHPADVVYLASWILLAVFLAGRALEARRWSSPPPIPVAAISAVVTSARRSAPAPTA